MPKYSPRLFFICVANASTEPFVESLVHDSIIVQIPLLRGQVNNRLEKVLSVFDQTRRDEYDSQVLDIEESEYEDDADMMYILRRLTAAAASARMRLDMDVEDEYYSAIEDRDTALMERERALQERELAIKERDKQLQQKSQEILQKDSQLQQKSQEILQKDSFLISRIIFILSFEDRELFARIKWVAPMLY